MDFKLIKVIRIMKKNIFVFFLLTSAFMNAQHQRISDVLKKLDFGNSFYIKKGYVVEEYKGKLSNISFVGNIVYTYKKNNNTYFLHYIKGNECFRLFFVGDFNYLYYDNISIANANKFLLYDVLNDKILLLRSGSTGLFSVDEGNIEISNSIKCLGRSIDYLDNQMNIKSSIVDINRKPCVMTFGYSDTGIIENQYEKELVTSKGDTIVIKNYKKPLFNLSLKELYNLLSICD